VTPWADVPKLRVESGEFAGTDFELKPGINRVGRSSENDIVLPEPSISSFHCELDVAEIGISVRDLYSTNGTFINRMRVVKRMVQSGDTLTLGAVDFALKLPEVVIAIPDIQTAEAPGAAFLSDGNPACFTHRETAAVCACTKCENWWCNDCLRKLKRLSGEFLSFCPECSAACAPMARPREARRKSFFTRVSDTLRLPRRK
jgi:hypothetical protein